MFSIAGRSFVGTHKTVNQDAFCALTAASLVCDAALICVCDGVGGLASGEVAASAVVREMARWFEGGFPAYAAEHIRGGSVDLAGIEDIWTGLLRDLNARMGRYSRDLNVRMGTTFTALLACGGSYALGHVGDCRAYLLRNGSLRQLTHDQTWVQLEVEAGRLRAEDALAHPRSSVIWQAVGVQEDLELEFRFGDLEDADTLLICCDGLYRRLGNDAVAEALRALPGNAGEPELLDAIDELVARAIDAGETDNLTGACLRVRGLAATSFAGAPPACPDDEPTITCPEEGSTAAVELFCADPKTPHMGGGVFHGVVPTSFPCRRRGTYLQTSYSSR